MKRHKMCKRLGAIGKFKFHLFLNKTFEEYEDFAQASADAEFPNQEMDFNKNQPDINWFSVASMLAKMMCELAKDNIKSTVMYPNPSSSSQNIQVLHRQQPKPVVQQQNNTTTE